MSLFINREGFKSYCDFSPSNDSARCIDFRFIGLVGEGGRLDIGTEGKSRFNLKITHYSEQII